MKVFCNDAIYVTIFHITYFKYAFEVYLFHPSSKIGNSNDCRIEYDQSSCKLCHFRSNFTSLLQPQTFWDVLDFLGGIQKPRGQEGVGGWSAKCPRLSMGGG